MGGLGWEEADGSGNECTACWDGLECMGAMHPPALLPGYHSTPLLEQTLPGGGKGYMLDQVYICPRPSSCPGCAHGTGAR